MLPIFISYFLLSFFLFSFFLSFFYFIKKKIVFILFYYYVFILFTPPPPPPHTHTHPLLLCQKFHVTPIHCAFTRQDKTLFTLGPLLNGVGGIYTKYLCKTRDKMIEKHITKYLKIQINI